MLALSGADQCGRLFTVGEYTDSLSALRTTQCSVDTTDPTSERARAHTREHATETVPKLGTVLGTAARDHTSDRHARGS